MHGYEYGFTKLLIQEFWYQPEAPQPFCEAVDWVPILAELDKRVKEKEAEKANQKRAKPAIPSKKPVEDDGLGEFGL